MRFVPVVTVLLLPLTPHSFTRTIERNNCRYERPLAPAVVPNDNRTAAGSIAGNVLTLNLTVGDAGWYPEGASGCGLRTAAFGEVGKAPQIPAPLIRVKVGTEMRVTVRNGLSASIRVAGLYDRGGATAVPVTIAAGETSSMQFTATLPGTYLYRASVFPVPPPGSPDPNTQLVGAFVVDSTETVPNDRIVMVTRWRKFIPTPQAVAADPVAATGQRILGAMNGLSWPHSERFQASVGDTIRWRVINGDAIAPHPMHLHGFYFRVTASGDMQHDTLYTKAQQRMAVTEMMPPGRTMSIEWLPHRAGNWLFHCHMVGHMSPNQRLDRILGEDAGLPPAPLTAHAQHSGHSHEMAGLILGISVSSKANQVRGSREATARAAGSRRQLRLLAHQKARVFGALPAYGFLLQDGSSMPPADSIRIPGSELSLTVGEPVEITVINRTTIPISVHWHGMELESYFDGVAGWSGDTRRLAPAIAPGDSFAVHITPPRAGTFIYHIHDEGGTELASGMYGPLIVRAHGVDTSNERTFVVADAGPGRGAGTSTFVNGSQAPDTVKLVAGLAYRFRLIGITANGLRRVSFVGADGPHPWRQIARDGWELGSPEPASRVPARIGPGITVDYEVKAETGDYLLEVEIPATAARPASFTRVPIRVRP